MAILFYASVLSDTSISGHHNTMSRDACHWGRCLMLARCPLACDKATGLGKRFEQQRRMSFRNVADMRVHVRQVRVLQANVVKSGLQRT
eukprot:3011-Heterococcus_DN1.PRE.6